MPDALHLSITQNRQSVLATVRQNRARSSYDISTSKYKSWMRPGKPSTASPTRGGPVLRKERE